MADSIPSSPEASGSSEFDTRTRIIEAAGPVFASRGFDGATVREICGAAGVNVASIAYHFGDKLGLYNEVVQGVRDSRERRFPSPGTDADPRRTLYSIVHTLLSRMLACDPSGWETQLIMREMSHPTPVFESIIEEFFRPMFERLIDAIERLIDGPAPRHTLEQLALSVVGQCLYYRIGSGAMHVLIPQQRREEHFDIDSLALHVTAVMLAALDSGAVLEKQAELQTWLGSIETKTETSGCSIASE